MGSKLMSKGSKRRKEDTCQVNDNWDSIDWDKPKKKEVKPDPRDIKDLYLNDKSL
jgi:hypothetical protein